MRQANIIDRLKATIDSAVKESTNATLAYYDSIECSKRGIRSVLKSSYNKTESLRWGMYKEMRKAGITYDGLPPPVNYLELIARCILRAEAGDGVSVNSIMKIDQEYFSGPAYDTVYVYGNGFIVDRTVDAMAMLTKWGLLVYPRNSSTPSLTKVAHVHILDADPSFWLSYPHPLNLKTEVLLQDRR